MSGNYSEQAYTHGFFSPYEAKAHREIKRMVWGLDFDGCTDRRVARAKLSDCVANFVVDHPEIERLDVIISSLRQTFFLDYFNATRNSVDEEGRRQSVTALNEELLEDIKWKIGLLFKRNRINRPVPEICFEPILLSDVYNWLHPGTTFQKMKEFEHYTQKSGKRSLDVQVMNLLKESVFLAKYNRKRDVFELYTRPGKSREFADTSKLLTIWFQLQHFANEYGAGNPFVFRFVDDNTEILDGVQVFFKKYPHLVPRGCSLELLYMSSNYGHYPPEYKPTVIVEGTGTVRKRCYCECHDIISFVERNAYSNLHPHDLMQQALLHNCPIPVKQRDFEKELTIKQRIMNATDKQTESPSPNSVCIGLN